MLRHMCLGVASKTPRFAMQGGRKASVERTYPMIRRRVKVDVSLFYCCASCLHTANFADPILAACAKRCGLATQTKVPNALAAPCRNPKDPNALISLLRQYRSVIRPF